MLGKAQRQKDQTMSGLRICQSKTGETVLRKNTEEARKLAKTLADIEEKMLRWKIDHKLEMREARRQLFVARAVASRRALIMLEALPKVDGSSTDKQNTMSDTCSIDGKEKIHESENELYDKEKQNTKHRTSSKPKADKLFIRRKEIPKLEGVKPNDESTFPSLIYEDKPREEDKPTQQCSLPKITKTPCITFTSLEVINDGQPSCIRAMSQMYKKKERKNLTRASTAPLLTTIKPLISTGDNRNKIVDQCSQKSKSNVKTTAQTKPLPSKLPKMKQPRTQDVEEINRAEESLRKMSEKLKEKTNPTEVLKARETTGADTECNGKIELESPEVSKDVLKVGIRRTSSLLAKNAEHVMEEDNRRIECNSSQSPTHRRPRSVNVGNFAIVYGCSHGLQKVEIKDKPPERAKLENGSERLGRKKSSGSFIMHENMQEREGETDKLSETEEEKPPPLPLRRHGNFTWREAVKRLTAASRFVRHLRPGNRPLRSLYPEDDKYRVTITGFGPAVLVKKSVASPITDPRFVNLQSSLVSVRAASASPVDSEELPAQTETDENSHTELNIDL